MNLIVLKLTKHSSPSQKEYHKKKFHSDLKPLHFEALHKKSTV